MLTQIPAFARGLLDVYQATGAVPQLTQRLEITDIQEVDRMARNLADRFAWWSRLDGSDADRYLALPNEIYLQTEHGYQQASLQGDATAGQVVLVKLEPASHGGFEFASITRHSPTSIESMLVTHSVDDSALDTCVLVHIEPQSHTGYQLYMNC